MYLDRFTLPTGADEERILAARMAYNGGNFGYLDDPYPCALFPAKELEEVRFSRITVLYGGNGSGKSTLLNLIAGKLGLARIAPCNTGEMFASYLGLCRYALGEDDDGYSLRIPRESRIITSDDIFDYMLAVRTNNEEISERKEEVRDEWTRLKYGETVRLGGMDDYEALRRQVLARSKSVSRRRFIRREVGSEVRLGSNGETALEYFETRLKNDTLYCLDEPENSMAPKMQLELKRMLEEMAHYCGCQFIIATHSPFLLALDGARIYDLDESPVREKQWWELENTRTYFEFFMRHRNLFEDE